MSQGWVVTQLERVLPRNIECLPHQREHLGLFDRVDTQVRFEIQIGIQHVARIAGLVTDQFEHRLHGDVAARRCDGRRDRRRRNHCRGRGRQRSWLSRRSRDRGDRWRSRRPRRNRRRHRPLVAQTCARTGAHGPGGLSRLARRRAIILDAQGTLLDFQGRRWVPGDVGKPALVGGPIRHPLFQSINATEHGHCDL